MRKSILLVLVVLLPLLGACSNKAKYSTEPVDLNFSLVERGSIHLTVAVKPEDDMVYYMSYLLTKSYYDSLATYEKDVMDYVISELMKDYNDYRDMVDPDHKETYFCSFSDFALMYASSQRTYSSLEPGTDYVAIAFCVNPQTNTPMGNLYHAQFSTIDWGDVKESTMDFQFRVWDVNDDEDNVHETRMYFKPVDNGVISKDYYVVGDAVDVDTVKLKFGGDLSAYIADYVQLYTDMEIQDAIIKKDIFEYAYLNNTAYKELGLTEGREYILWAMPYSLDAYYKIRYHRFTYQKDYKESGYVQGILWTGEQPL